MLQMQPLIHLTMDSPYSPTLRLPQRLIHLHLIHSTDVQTQLEQVKFGFAHRAFNPSKRRSLSWRGS